MERRPFPPHSSAPSMGESTRAFSYLTQLRKMKTIMLASGFDRASAMQIATKAIGRAINDLGECSYEELREIMLYFVTEGEAGGDYGNESY